MSKCATLIVLASIALMGCEIDAELRATNDEKIGHFEAGGVRVDVDDGLAAIRASGGTIVDVHVSAPKVTIRVEGPLNKLALTNLFPGAVVLQGAATLTMTGANEGDLLWTGSAAASFVVGPPDSDSPEPFVIAVLGDPQNNPPVWKAVIADINKDKAIRYVVVDGDWSSTSDTEAVLTEMLDIATTLNVPFYGTIGNADLGPGGAELLQERIGRLNSSFAYRGVRHVLVDDSEASIAPKVRGWIEDWGTRPNTDCKLFHAHIPLLDPHGLRGGGFRDTDEALATMARLKALGFDHLFFGHLHSFYTGSLAGVPSTISGGAGGPQETADGLSWHYLRVEIDPKECAIRPTVVRVEVDDAVERLL